MIILLTSEAINKFVDFFFLNYIFQNTTIVSFAEYYFPVILGRLY